MVKILMLTGTREKPRRSTTPSSASKKRVGRSRSRRTEKRVFHSVVHDFEPGFDTYTEKPGYRVQADLGLDEVVAGRLSRAGPARRPGARVPEEPARRPCRSFATSSRRASRSRPIATVRCCCWPPAT